MKTSRFVRFWISVFSLSTSVPLRPMMMPGREVKMSIFSLFAARAISTFETPACAKRRFQVVPQPQILVQQLRVVLVREPARAPGLVESQPEPVRVNFLAHVAILVSLLGAAGFGRQQLAAR